jgi:ABC-type transporter Mla subunit MlaD
MSKSPLDKIKGETRLLENIVLAVPGFRGYKEKELRREADRLLRDSLYRRLKSVRADLETVFQNISDNRVTQHTDDLNRLIAKIDLVSEQINHASYGYSGFFDAVKIEEDDLDNMLAFDSKLIDQISRLLDETKAFKSDVLDRKPDTISQHTSILTRDVERLKEEFAKRDEIIKGVSL